MNRISSWLLLGAVVGGASFPAVADSKLLRFDGGIGVHPVAGISEGLPVPNTVRGVAPGGRIWVIDELKAAVKPDGSISVRGEGLVLGAGEAIGTAGAVTMVVATLFCGPQGHDSPPAPLSRDGDFEIRGQLAGAPPHPCPSPVLLIRNATTGAPGAWFAAGIPKD